MKTIAAATLALLVTPAALAQGSSVTVYGLFDAALRQASNSAPDGSPLRSMEDGIMTGSRLGVRTREDMGGGMAALLTLEAGFDPGNGTSLQGTNTADYGQAQAPMRFWGREAHLGLRGAWGGVTLGRQYTVAHGIAGRFQPQGNPNSTAHSLFSSHHIARQDNMLRLDTKAAGVDLAASYTLGERPGSSANSSWAVGAGYAAKTWYLGGYAQQMKNLAGTETRKIVGLGGNVKLGDTVALFGGAMQRTSAVSPQENRAFTLGANVELSPQVTLSVAVYDDQQSGSAALEGSRRVAWLTASYRFSRRTDVYAVVDTNRVEGGYARPAFMGTMGSQTGLTGGLRHRF